MEHQQRIERAEAERRKIENDRIQKQLEEKAAEEQVLIEKQRQGALLEKEVKSAAMAPSQPSASIEKPKTMGTLFGLKVSFCNLYICFVFKKIFFYSLSFCTSKIKAFKNKLYRE